MKPRLLIAGTLLLVFAAGVAVGSAIQVLRATTRAPAAGSWAELARALELSPEQRRQIDLIFATYQPKTDALLVDLVPRLQALADSMDADLLPLLTPSQREELARVRMRPQFLLRRKTPQGERVDTIRLQPRNSR